jgi:hypothetical protein
MAGSETFPIDNYLLSGRNFWSNVYMDDCSACLTWLSFNFAAHLFPFSRKGDYFFFLLAAGSMPAVHHSMPSFQWNRHAVRLSTFLCIYFIYKLFCLMFGASAWRKERKKMKFPGSDFITIKCLQRLIKYFAYWINQTSSGAIRSKFQCLRLTRASLSVLDEEFSFVNVEFSFGT